jgi:hypothetical protein
MTASTFGRRVADSGATRHLDAFRNVPAFSGFVGNQSVSAATIGSIIGRIPERTLIDILSDLPDDSLVDILKNLPSDDVAKIIRDFPDAQFNRIVERLPGMVDDLRTKLPLRMNDTTIDTGDITTTTPPDTVPGPQDIGELFEAPSLAPGQRYDDASLERLGRQFDELDAYGKFQITAPYRSGGQTLSPEFKSLPEPIKRKFLRSDPVLRWNARRTQGPYDYVRSACKAMPVGCAIGSAIGLAGLGYATVELHDRVKDLYDKSDEVRACIATCLPNDWYSSEASGSGTLDYDELDFKDLEELKETSGNDDLTAANTPLCNANMTPEGCINMCESRCEDLNSTFLQDLTEAAGDAGRNLANEAGDVAGEGLAAFLDGIFGEDMGIPAAIAIFIFIVIVMVVVAM